MSAYFGTAYGKLDRLMVLSDEAKALAACDAYDRGYCVDCDAIVTITLAPYGPIGKIATISCPNCGDLYDSDTD